MEKDTSITTPKGFNHILLTRFNLQYEDGDTKGIQPDWLEKRCYLFEHYCLSSIQAQTEQDFIWILIMDERTPEPFRSRILGYENCMKQIQVKVVSFYPNTEDLFHEIGLQFGHSGAILISSRVDNDDCLAEDYISQVQQLALKGLRGVISFPEGRQTFIKEGVSYRIRFLENHFLSRIETEGFYTIMEFNHREACKYGVLPIDTIVPMWEEIVHSSNMLNDYVPEYHYYITNWSDYFDLSRRWIRFEFLRIKRVLQRLLISIH